MIRQAFQFRLRERPSQAARMRQFAGCRRRVWNLALERQQTRRAANEPYAGFSAMCKWVTAWRNDPALSYLKEAPVHALQDAVRSLDAAFQRFFRKEGGYPSFKRRCADEGWRETDTACFDVDVANSRIRLPKLGWVRFRQSRPLEGRPCTVALRRGPNGWLVSIQTEREGLLPSSATAAVGIDRGVTNTIACSDGTLVPALNAQKQQLARLKRYQRACARKMEAAKRAAGLEARAPWPKGLRVAKSNRLRRAEAKVIRLHARIRATRETWLHTQSRQLADQHALIVIEDLKVKSMSASAAGTTVAPGRRVKQKSGLNRAILDQGWGLLARQLEYKLAWRGGLLIKVPPAYTSQTCAVCGHVAAENRHGERFECEACGHTAHADINAAKNILAAGHAVLAGADASSHADVEATQSRSLRKRQPTRAREGADSGILALKGEEDVKI